jgi:hypothetical protein
MPGTFSQIYIHAIFAVKGLENLLRSTWHLVCLTVQGFKTFYPEVKALMGNLFFGLIIYK